MSSLLKIVKLPPSQFKTTAAVYTAVRNAHWNKDWMPDPFPVTPEERQKAAKKYGVLPVEYKPFADDGLGRGDYPDIPLESAEARDPYYPWDYPETRRNFNEPMPREFDMIGLDRYNVNAKYQIPLKYQFLTLFSVLSSTFLFYWWVDDKRWFWSLKPKQYLFDGKQHYTFETE